MNAGCPDCFVDSHLEKNCVRVKLFPQHEFVTVERTAAAHLFRLLQRYNWCLESKAHYPTRWAAFWPEIDPIERQLLYCFVMTNCGGRFGRRLEVVDSPIGFEAIEGALDRPVFSRGVELEFRRLLTVYFRVLVTPADVRTWWAGQCPAQYALLKAASAQDLPFEAAVGLHLDVFQRECAACFRRLGIDACRAEKASLALMSALDVLLVEREIELWSEYTQAV